MSAACGDRKRRSPDRPEAFGADAEAILLRLANDTGGCFAELSVCYEDSETRLLACGDIRRAEVPFDHIRVDEVDGETLFLRVGFAPGTAHSPLSTLSAEFHPAVLAFFRSWWRSGRSRERLLPLQTLLRRSDHGWILLDTQHRIRWANARAESLLDSADTIHRSGPSIAASAMADTIDLRRIMTEAAGVLVGRRLMLLAREGVRQPLALFVSGLPDETEPDGTMLVMEIVDPERDPTAAVAMLGAAYRLPAAEQSIVSYLVAGYSATQAAQQVDIKTSTARAHLQSIFIKMNVKSQAALMRLFLLSSPS